MSFASLFLIAVGLSMDAFAVSVCKGLNMKKLNINQTLLISLFFGGFQALMPLIGYFLGQQFAEYIKQFDHYIAFILLAFIGGKMVIESLKHEETADSDTFKITELFILAVATSIDALAVGITFALLDNVSIWFSVSVIGITTFVLSLIGVFTGHKFGAVLKNKAELMGGIILILIGLKILLEHLEVINFGF
ncbi:MAG: manganese efflux pump MntP family protein [Clostridia bacterium]|nr:manganese efflux pump MntP family protein [Clostridia bacterium]